MNEQAFDVGHLGLGALPVDQAFIGAGAPVSRRTLRSEPAFSGHVGLGQIFKKDPAYIGHGTTSGGGVQINPTHKPVSGAWVPLGTIDKDGNFTASDPTGQFDQYSDLQDTLNNWASNIITLAAAGAKFGGYFYFGLSDSNSGAAQTPGEPPGMAIMRISKSGQLDMCTSPAMRAVAAPLPYSAPPPPVTAPTTDNTIWWVLLGLTVAGVGGYLILD
jgi:hypothetical protein